MWVNRSKPVLCSRGRERLECNFTTLLFSDEKRVFGFKQAAEYFIFVLSSKMEQKPARGTRQATRTREQQSTCSADSTGRDSVEEGVVNEEQEDQL